MKSYKDYINESLNINPDRYVYPYKKILIIINNEEEYLETISYFERIIDIRFFNVANYEEPIILVVAVLNLYKLISDNNGSGNFWSIFDIFRKRISDSTFNEFLEYIKSFAPPIYFNMDDVIYKSSDLKLINYLLIDGNKNMFKHLYLNKNKKSYESLLSKLQGPSEEEVMKNIENKWLDEQLEIFINNGYMKGILKIKKMFDDDIYGEGVDEFKSFKGLLEQTNLHISDILNFPTVLEFIDKYGVLNLYKIESMIKECILNSKKDSLNYLLKKYNNDAKITFSTPNNKIYLSNPMLRNDFDIVEVLLNNGIFDSNPYFYFNQAIKYGGEEMGELFIKKYNFKESLLNNIVYKRK